jgi:hypothetical protein
MEQSTDTGFLSGTNRQKDLWEAGIRSAAIWLGRTVITGINRARLALGVIRLCNLRAIILSKLIYYSHLPTDVPTK